jgi:hypothetical protein
MTLDSAVVETSLPINLRKRRRAALLAKPCPLSNVKASRAEAINSFVELRSTVQSNGTEGPPRSLCRCQDQASGCGQPRVFARLTHMLHLRVDTPAAPGLVGGDLGDGRSLELPLAVALVYDDAAQDATTRCWSIARDSERSARLCLIDLRAVIDTLCVLPSVPAKAGRPLIFLCPP